MGTLQKTLSKSVQNFLDDDCLSSGAAVAFYTIFSLPSLLVIVLLIASSLGFSQMQVNRVIHQELGFPAGEVESATKDSRAGKGPVDVLSNRSSDEPDSKDSSPGTSAASAPSTFAIGNLGLISKVIGVCVLMFSATGIFGQLQFTLNRVWEVEPDPRQGGLKTFLLKRLLSAGMVLAIGFILLVSLILTTMLDQILKLVKGTSPGFATETIALGLNEVTSFAVAVLLFAAMFKLLPDAKLRWKDVWLGAATTAFMFIVGKAFIGWYLRTSQIGSSWGASAASTVAALVWVYYSSLIVLFGAEVSQVWATRNGAITPPTDGAVRTIEEKHHIRDPQQQQASHP
jgi:membrane protein